MKRGPKTGLPSEKRARSTYRPHRHDQIVEVTAPRDLPRQPDWLTEDGQQCWLDLIGRVSSANSATELDSELLGHFANLSGACRAAWRAGSVPPAAYLTLVRQFSEMFRIGGDASRLGMKPTIPADNPFARLRKSAPDVG